MFVKMLLAEYLESKRITEKMLEDCTADEDRKILNSILNELKFVIKWLRCGYNPTDYKGIERIQTHLIDQQVIEAVIDESPYVKAGDDEYKDYIEEMNHPASQILSNLSTKELEIFLMYKCEGLSSRDIGALINMKHKTVETHIERGMKKVIDGVKDYEVEQMLSEYDLSYDRFKAVVMLSEYDTKSDSFRFVDESLIDYRIADYFLRKLKGTERKDYLQHKINKVLYEDIAKSRNVKTENVIKNIESAEKKIKSYFGIETISVNRFDMTGTNKSA